MKIVALIVAAGQGKRMNSKIGKPFIPIIGKPILFYTLKKFENCELIDQIYLVINGSEKEYCLKNVILKYRFKKVQELILGGDTRQMSVFNGLNLIDSDADIVVIHDGARPLVNEKIILESIKTSQKYGAVVAAIPSKDTIKEVENNFFIHTTLDREKIWRAQTPQTFKYKLILSAYKKAFKSGYFATDDAALLEKSGYKVKMIKGSEENIKITSPFDIAIAEKYLMRGNDLNSG